MEKNKACGQAVLPDDISHLQSNNYRKSQKCLPKAIPIRNTTSCQQALEKPISKQLILRITTPTAMIVCLPMYLLQPAIRSDVKPVMILANVNTAMKAGPAKIWYSIPLPVQLYSHLGSAIQMLPFSNLSQKLTADVSLELTASHFWSPNWTSENSNHIGILIGYAVKKEQI